MSSYVGQLMSPQKPSQFQQYEPMPLQSGSPYGPPQSMQSTDPFAQPQQVDMNDFFNRFFGGSGYNGTSLMGSGKKMQ